MQTPLRTIILAAALAALVTTAGSRDASAAGEPACSILPPNNPWNTDISNFPLHPQSDAFVNSIGRTDHLHPDFGTVWNGAPIGIPYVIVPGAHPKAPVQFSSWGDDESDPGPYPIPPNAPIEGAPTNGNPNFGGDRHVLVIDDSNCMLYELFDAHAVNGGQSWTAGSGRGVRPELERAAARLLDIGRRRRASDLPWTRALRGGRPAGRHRPCPSLHDQHDAARVHPPGDSLRLETTPTRTCRRWACASA